MILSILKREGKHIISSPLAKTSVGDLILRIHISVKVMGPGLGIKMIIKSCFYGMGSKAFLHLQENLKKKYRHDVSSY